MATDGYRVVHAEGDELPGRADLPRHPRRVPGHAHVGALAHGDVLGAKRSGVLHLRESPGEELPLGDLADHPHQFFLDELVAGDGLVAELLAEAGVLQGGVVAGHGGADDR